MHSLINLIPRTHSGGKPYFQARFFDKSGHLIQSVNLSGIEFRTEAYLYARQYLKRILTPAMSEAEIEQYGILSADEVKRILALPCNNPHDTRNTLIALLGITCGLGVSEICNLKRGHITQDDMFSIETANGQRIIPFIRNVKCRLLRLHNFYLDSPYVIPNLKDMNKPCNPISITRGLSSVLSEIGVGNGRNIVPSILRETFLTLMQSCHMKYKKEIDMRTLDYLCGFIMQDAESSRINGASITAIQRLMMALENMNYWTTGIINWG